MEEQQRNETGQNEDLKYLIRYTSDKVEVVGETAVNISLDFVNQMFLSVADGLQSGQNAQKKWLTVSDYVQCARRLEATHDDPGG